MICPVVLFQLIKMSLYYMSWCYELRRRIYLYFLCLLFFPFLSIKWNLYSWHKPRHCGWQLYKITKCFQYQVVTRIICGDVMVIGWYIVNYISYILSCCWKCQYIELRANIPFRFLFSFLIIWETRETEW